MPPKRRAGLRAATPARTRTTPLSHDDSTLDSGDSRTYQVTTAATAKRRIVASNAKDINDMKDQLTSMSSLLRSISDRMPVGAAAAAAPPATPAPRQHADQARCRAQAQAPDDRPRSPSPEPEPPVLPGPFSDLSQPHASTHRLRHQSATHPYYSRPSQGWLQARRDARRQTPDPLGSTLAQNNYREDLPPLHKLEDQDEINRVAQMISTSLAPLGNPNGKRFFAHFYVRRGSKRARTTLGDLTIPEYNFGFISLMNSSDTFDHDKPAMFRHLSHVNEDAVTYRWQDVRSWSEEVSALVADGKMSWDDEYRIDLLRLKLSQRNPITTGELTLSESPRDHGKEPFIVMTPEVRAAKHAPPCKAFTAGSCSYPDHHVHNGYRQLHVCAHCLLQKCAPFPHSREKCKSKLYAASKNPAPREGLGFGK